MSALLILQGLLFFFVAACRGDLVFTPARPPAIPLAVRSPYLNTWLQVGSDGGTGGYLTNGWSTFWNGAITPWAGQIRVDGEAYAWMGTPGTQAVQQTAVEYTSTRSTFILNVGNAVEMNVTFLSPIFPNDYKRQSLVFSYVNVAVVSLDGAQHDVQIYADISAEWVSGDRSSIAQWDYGVTGADSSSTKTKKQAVPFDRRDSFNATASSATSAPTSTYPAGGVAYHKLYRQSQLSFSEVNDQTEYGSWYWATDNNEKLTYQAGSDVTVRGTFASNGFLADTIDTNYRAIKNNWPVFAFSSNLGSVGSTPVETLFSIGLTQDYAIQYNTTKGYNPVPSLWKSYFPDSLAALSFFQGDYSYASGESGVFDDKVLTDSISAGGKDYYTITALVARQAFAATQLTGTPDNIYLFLKEISSDGNLNTVDVIFPMHPILLYTNPDLLQLLLKPLYENQEAGLYPNKYSMHDIGSSYPNATGHPDGNDEEMPLEECGNMIIMTLAYAQRTGNNEYLGTHYKLLQQWAQYLIDEALIPASQISTDDFAGPLANQTNLALKGIIGIQAMSEIAKRTGNLGDSQNYAVIANDYITKWQVYGIASDVQPPHTTLAYGNNASYGLLYNLFADTELGLKFVPESVYEMQSNFYPTVMAQYGVPLDTRHTLTKMDWELWAAFIASPETRSLFFSVVANWINTTPTNHALTDLYDTVTGNYQGSFIARPVVGAAFGGLILD